MVLWHIHKSPLTTKNQCNQLSLSLGNEPHLWFLHSLGGVTTGSVESPLLPPPLAIDVSSEYTITFLLRYGCDSWWNKVLMFLDRVELALRVWESLRISTSSSFSTHWQILIETLISDTDYSWLDHQLLIGWSFLHWVDTFLLFLLLMMKQLWA